MPRKHSSGFFSAALLKGSSAPDSRPPTMEPRGDKESDDTHRRGGEISKHRIVTATKKRKAVTATADKTLVNINGRTIKQTEKGKIYVIKNGKRVYI